MLLGGSFGTPVVAAETTQSELLPDGFSERMPVTSAWIVNAGQSAPLPALAENGPAMASAALAGIPAGPEPLASMQTYSFTTGNGRNSLSEKLTAAQVPVPYGQKLLVSWDTGFLGVLSTGVVANYDIHSRDGLFPAIAGATGKARKSFDGRIKAKYGSRFGWTGGPDGGWNLTGFLNYIPHPHVLHPGSALGEEMSPRQESSPRDLIHGGVYTLDMRFGYRTESRPATALFRNVDVNVTLSDLMDSAPQHGRPTPFTAIDPALGLNLIRAQQRALLLNVVKSW